MLRREDDLQVFEDERDMLVQTLGILKSALGERGLEDHMVYVRVDQALTSGDLDAMRRVFEDWKRLPPRVRTNLLRA